MIYLSKLSRWFMPIMNIPIGNQMVGIDVPNFAMEATQQDILDALRGQEAAARAGASAQTQTTNAVNSSTGRIVTAVSQSIGNIAQPIANAVQRGSQTGAGLINAVDTGSASRVLRELTSAIPPLGLGLQTSFKAVGSAATGAASILEDYAQNVTNLRRAGAGLTGELSELRVQAGSVGLRFSEFSQLVGQNAQQLLNFGSNTDEGARGMLNVTRQFRDMSAEMGHYGLTNRQMAQLIIDESEARRRTTGMLSRTSEEMGSLASQVNANVGLHEQMARIMGQDVRARLEAQRAVSESAVVQTRLNNALPEVRTNLGHLAAAIAQIAPTPEAGKKIANDIIESVGGGVAFQAKNPQLYAMFGEYFRPLEQLARRIYNDSSISAEEVAAQSAELVSKFRYISSGASEALMAMAATGNEAANLGLSLGNNARKFGAANSIYDEVMNQRARIERDGSAQIGGLSSEMGRLAAVLNSNLFSLGTELIPGGEGAGGHLTSSVRGLANIIDNSMGSIRSATRDYRVEIENALASRLGISFDDLSRNGQEMTRSVESAAQSVSAMSNSVGVTTNQMLTSVEGRAAAVDTATAAPSGFIANLSNMLSESSARYHMEITKLYGDLPNTMSNAMRSGGPIPVIDVGGDRSTGPGPSMGGQTNYVVPPGTN